LSVTFPVHSGLKRKFSSSLLFSFAFEYAVKKVRVKEERVGVKLGLSYVQGRTGWRPLTFKEEQAEDIKNGVPRKIFGPERK
jgi:hypothetical protein